MNDDKEIKSSFGAYLVRFFDLLVADTKALEEFKSRQVSKAIAFAPARLIDSVDDMLAKWQKFSADGTTKSAHNLLPVMLVAMDKTFTPTGRSGSSYQITDSPFVIMKNDPKERAFKIRTISSDYRAQVVIFSQDVASARSIASQLMLFVDALENRRMSVNHRFSGIDETWIAQVSNPDNPVMNIPNGAKNLTILTVDFTIKTTTPMYSAPALGEPNDGKGDPLNKDDLAGFLLVELVTSSGNVVSK